MAIHHSHHDQFIPTWCHHFNDSGRQRLPVYRKPSHNLTARETTTVPPILQIVIPTNSIDSGFRMVIGFCDCSVGIVELRVRNAYSQRRYQ
jgi:hypothetical protein